MIRISYQRWNSAYKEIAPIKPSIQRLDSYNNTAYAKRKNIGDLLLEEASKYAHDNEMVYFVTVFENDKPISFLEINKAFFRVCFLDEHLRQYLSYTFYGKDGVAEHRNRYGNKLFLEDITFWEFEGKSDKKLKIADYKFRPDGSFFMQERDQVTNEQFESEAKNRIDVSVNWSNYPEFGKYEDLIKKRADKSGNGMRTGLDDGGTTGLV